MFQRFSSAKTEKIAIRGFLLSGLAAFPLSFIPPLLGMFGKALLPDADSSSVFMQLLLTRLPVVVVAILLAAIICSVMGACNAVFVSSSTIVVHDVYQGILQKGEKGNRKVMMTTNLIICLVGVFLAIRMNDIIKLLTLGYLVVSSGCLIPFLGGLLWKRGSTPGALCAAFAGVASAVADSLVIIHLPYPCISSLAISATAYIIGSLCFKERIDNNAE